MIHFKHLKSGMSLLEVIAAIAILAIFGSSLFIMQTYLFDRIQLSQRKMIASLRMQSQLIAYQSNILKELFAQEGPVEKSLHEEIKESTRPDMAIKISTRSDFQETPLKNFKNLYLITTQAAPDTWHLAKTVDGRQVMNDSQKEYGKIYTFVYIPEVQKE